jgi:hypothetical protein
VFDLDAPIHDDGETTGLRDTPAFLVDHGKLTPETGGADRHGLPGDLGQRIRRAEDVDDVDGNRYVGETVEAFLAEYFLLARVDRNDAIPVALEIEPDEVARAQMVPRQPDDGDGLRAVDHALDRQRILIASQIE